MVEEKEFKDIAIISTPTKNKTAYYEEYTECAIANTIEQDYNIIFDEDLLNKVNKYITDYNINISKKIDKIKIADVVVLYYIDELEEHQFKLLQKAIKEDKEVMTKRF